MYFEQIGQCTACKSGTLLITGDHMAQCADQGIYEGSAGTCTPICNSDQYEGYMQTSAIQGDQRRCHVLALGKTRSVHLGCVATSTVVT